jgi:hypothetical protein
MATLCELCEPFRTRYNSSLQLQQRRRVGTVAYEKVRCGVDQAASLAKPQYM